MLDAGGVVKSTDDPRFWRTKLRKVLTTPDFGAAPAAPAASSGLDSRRRDPAEKADVRRFVGGGGRGDKYNGSLGLT